MLKMKPKRHLKIQNAGNNSKLLRNGLLSDIKGDWIVSILPDSILKYKKVLPWRDVFYGDLFLSINDSDTLLIGGHMDNISLKFITIDSSTLKLPEWDNSTFKYSEEKSVILAPSRIFKKLEIKEFGKIIREEEALMKYVIGLLFTEDFMYQEEISRINYISLGVETYTPFTFDAIGIISKEGIIEHFGWEFKGDTLNLYSTSFTHDEDSGFKFYKLGELDKQYIKNN